MTKLFDKKQWIGEFFVPNQYENRFPGKVDYSPENGVILSYVITGHEVPTDSDVVFGVLDTGEKCTLVGKFTPQDSGFRVRQGLTTRPRNIHFSCLLIGDFVAHDELFCDIAFSLTNMQEFFLPKEDRELLEDSNNPLYKLKTSYGEISLGNNAKGRFLRSEFTSNIYSLDTDSAEELNNAFENIKSKHPSAYLILKKDISYGIVMKLDVGETIQNLYKYVSDIANLFAILMYNPVHPESIKITKKDNDDALSFIQIYPSLRLDNRTIGLCIKDREHLSLPISNKNINLASVLTSWLNSCRSHSVIISSIQYKTGFKTEHDLHGEIVLYATQLESISHTDGKKNEKYKYSLDTYSCERIRKGMEKIFTNAGERDIGKGIGNLRNEIAHIGKPKKLLTSFSIRDLGYISQYLHVTIIGYILSTLGIDKNVIENYQKSFAPPA